MGNCCGTPKDENFKGDGQTLGAAPANAPPQQGNARAAAPPKPKGPQGPGRTLGKNPQDGGSAEDPKAAAARAAEERAKASQNQNKGKLGRQLDQQRGQSQTGILAQNARDNVAARDADAAAEARNYN
ncbi:hypothetical protein KC367_g516 [Hortaea werneckii]|nr:hypothetical protein KC361_g2385 [Hortaea werneckii]OTA38191.1 hypothetical protein BTJ68_01502 [Hortaea werneckii EXF-2000]KAI6842485.1 hypothetical protein KC342_g1643 [Hortaea werneckii]KAI6843386.1 hypothetical protein KC358_g3863 [Hortaea werneckii]KAI6852798.1 hypothetical protein KC350_g561 [Hortaea werneckii]